MCGTLPIANSIGVIRHGRKYLMRGLHPGKSCACMHACMGPGADPSPRLRGVKSRLRGVSDVYPYPILLGGR